MKRSILFRTLCVLVGFLFTSVITVFGSNVTNEFEKVLALAEQGDPLSQCKLGQIYEDGLYGVTKDEAKAAEWFTKGLKSYTKEAEEGDVETQDYLGSVYMNGWLGVAKDEAKALEWFTKAAAGGHAAAMLYLGNVYHNGLCGVAKDEAKALEWFIKSAEHGNVHAKSIVELQKRRVKKVEYPSNQVIAKKVIEENWTKLPENATFSGGETNNIMEVTPSIVTPSVIEGYWANVLENATRISVGPRSKGAESQKGEGILEAFGMQYMPNAYEYYQEVRAKAIEREQIFKENFPEGEKSDSTGGRLYTKVQKATAKAVGEYFRRRDELCHFYLMHKAGIMNSQELMKLDEAKISTLLPAIGSEFVELKSEVSKPTATERTFAEKYMTSTLAAYDRISKQMTETLELHEALALDYSILDALRGALALNVVASRFNLILENNNAIVETFKKNSLLYTFEKITVGELAKQDEELSVKMQSLEKKLPIHDYGKEWLFLNWTDNEEFNVIFREVPDFVFEATIMALRSSMVEIPGKDYLMSKYEVTQGLWKAVMGENPSKFKGASTKPVENVSWNDIQEFLKKLNEHPKVKASGLVYRLPTADEWEYACRAGATGDYCRLADGTEITKATLGDVAWFKDNSNEETHPVGQKKPNAYGLYDMHGNVWEWIFTVAGDFYAYVFYGGSWYKSSDICQSSYRFRRDSDVRGSDLGFRLCASSWFVELKELKNSMVKIPDKDYLMSKYEVTQGLWEAVMGNNPSEFKGDPRRPVDRVSSWYAIQEFLEKLNKLPEVQASGLEYRLPTAEEWEYACRAGATGDYCKLADGTEITKETLGDVAWFYDNRHSKTHPVGQKKPNAYGLYDMHGNVWELTSTIVNDIFYISCGGSWSASSYFCQSSNRSRIRFGDWDYCAATGFRLCASSRADKAQEGK